ncbi:hypothetical protein L21SP2_3316 [Salinispira pacifica]|uniref:Uncharacterized protein n=1 Tax=Salinispira pacifica TaxID=1307761 RepID=V5WNP5_9SPIO|nr:hypothetical protein L21SP2_3316 [Salinispira pacifica]
MFREFKMRITDEPPVLCFQAGLLALLRPTLRPSRFPSGMFGFRLHYSSGGCAGFSPDFRCRVILCGIT